MTLWLRGCKRRRGFVMWSNKNSIWRPDKDEKSQALRQSVMRVNEAKHDAHFPFPRLHTTKEVIWRAAEQQGETKHFKREWVEVWRQVPYRDSLRSFLLHRHFTGMRLKFSHSSSVSTSLDFRWVQCSRFATFPLCTISCDCARIIKAILIHLLCNYHMN